MKREYSERDVGVLRRMAGNIAGGIAQRPELYPGADAFTIANDAGKIARFIFEDPEMQATYFTPSK